METTLLERFLIVFLAAFFFMRCSNDVLDAIGLIETNDIHAWPYYVMALAIAALYIIITTAGKK